MKIIKINLWNQGRWNDGRNITRNDHINIITEGKYFAETLQVEVDCLFTPEILTFPLQPVFFGSLKLTFITSWSEVPWIPEPSTVNNKLKRREGSGSTGRFFD